MEPSRRTRAAERQSPSKAGASIRCRMPARRGPRVLGASLVIESGVGPLQPLAALERLGSALSPLGMTKAVWRARPATGEERPGPLPVPGGFWENPRNVRDLPDFL